MCQSTATIKNENKCSSLCLNQDAEMVMDRNDETDRYNIFLRMSAWIAGLSTENSSLILLLVSAGSYSIMGCFVKLITNSTNHSIPAIEIVLFRAVFQLIIVVTGMFFITIPVPSAIASKVDDNYDNDVDNNYDDDESRKLHQQPELPVEPDAQLQNYVDVPLIRYPLGLSKDIVWLCIMRGICGGGGFCFYFYTISVLPLGDAITLLSLNPVFTLVIASMVLHEPLTKTYLFSAISSVVGCIFLAQPSFLFGQSVSNENGDVLINNDVNDNDIPSDNLPSTTSFNWGYLTGITGACTGAGTYILLRKGGKKGVHTFSMLFSWCVCGLFFSSVLTVAAGNFVWPSSTTTWYYLLWSCIFGTIAHILLNYAGRLAPAGIASIIRSSGIIWSYLLEVIVFHQIPEAWTIVGVGLIILSLGVIAFEKQQESQQQYHHYQHQRLATSEEEAVDNLQMQPIIKGHSTENGDVDDDDDDDTDCENMYHRRKGSISSFEDGSYR